MKWKTRLKTKLKLQQSQIVMYPEVINSVNSFQGIRTVFFVLSNVADCNQFNNIIILPSHRLISRCWNDLISFQDLHDVFANVSYTPFKFIETSLKLEIRLHAYQFDRTHDLVPKYHLRASDWLMRSEVGYFLIQASNEDDATLRYGHNNCEGVRRNAWNSKSYMYVYDGQDRRGSMGVEYRYSSSERVFLMTLCEDVTLPSGTSFRLRDIKDIV